MVMFLSRISTIMIQKIIQFHSEAFLEHICDQVEYFTAVLSHKMLEFEIFCHLDADPASDLPDPSPN